jgi:hypothetical protein
VAKNAVRACSYIVPFFFTFTLVKTNMTPVKHNMPQAVSLQQQLQKERKERREVETSLAATQSSLQESQAAAADAHVHAKQIHDDLEKERQRSAAELKQQVDGEMHKVSLAGSMAMAENERLAASASELELRLKQALHQVEVKEHELMSRNEDLLQVLVGVELCRCLLGVAITHHVFCFFFFFFRHHHGRNDNGC